MKRAGVGRNSNWPREGRREDRMAREGGASQAAFLGTWKEVDRIMNSGGRGEEWGRSGHALRGGFLFLRQRLQKVKSVSPWQGSRGLHPVSRTQASCAFHCLPLLPCGVAAAGKDGASRKEKTTLPIGQRTADRSLLRATLPLGQRTADRSLPRTVL